MTELLTYQQAAEHLGLKPHTLRTYRTEGKFPDPDRQYGTTPLWTVETIDAWQAERDNDGGGNQ